MASGKGQGSPSYRKGGITGKACPSVLRTKCSKSKALSSEKSRCKYFKVSASQKLAIRSFFVVGTCTSEVQGRGTGRGVEVGIGVTELKCVVL